MTRSLRGEYQFQFKFGAKNEKCTSLREELDEDLFEGLLVNHSVGTFLKKKNNKKKYFDFIYFEFNFFFVFNFELCNISWPTTVAKVFFFLSRIWNNILRFFSYNAPGFITESLPPSHPRDVGTAEREIRNLLVGHKKFYI